MIYNQSTLTSFDKCLNQLKHQAIADSHAEHQRSAITSNDFFIDHLIEEETHRLIYEAISELPPKCREILHLSIQELKNDEIAEKMRVSVNTVKKQKAIAYSRLRIKLKSLLCLLPLLS